MTTSDTTTYTDTVDGTLSDLAVGDNVVVTGSTSGDQLAATEIVDRGTLETRLRWWVRRWWRCPERDAAGRLHAP